MDLQGIVAAPTTVTKQEAKTDKYISLDIIINGMERGERIRLEAIKRNLEVHLKTISDMLRKASAPKRRSKREVSKRAHAICRAVARMRRPLKEDELRKIVKKHGIPYATVGALYAAKYLKKSKRGIELGKKGRISTSMRTRRATDRRQRT